MGLIGSFFGSDQRKDLRRAKAQADAHLQQGYDAAYGDYTGVMESFDPYVQSGTQSQKFYDDLLGLNGPEARAAAQQIVTSDPQFQGAMAENSNAMLRHLNARGASGGGKAQLAGQRVLNQTYGDWINRYQQGGAQGLNATNAMAGYRAGRGDLSYGYGATRAGHETNFGNAMAASRNIGINNLLNVAGTAAKFVSPTPV